MCIISISIQLREKNYVNEKSAMALEMHLLGLWMREGGAGIERHSLTRGSTGALVSLTNSTTWGGAPRSSYTERAFPFLDGMLP